MSSTTANCQDIEVPPTRLQTKQARKKTRERTRGIQKPRYTSQFTFVPYAECQSKMCGVSRKARKISIQPYEHVLLDIVNLQQPIITWPSSLNNMKHNNNNHHSTIVSKDLPNDTTLYSGKSSLPCLLFMKTTNPLTTLRQDSTSLQDNMTSNEDNNMIPVVEDIFSNQTTWLAGCTLKTKKIVRTSMLTMKELLN
ncbi:hypothetical protein C9374_000108 [Naegleria lovaniensis]|uniref:Uncharacterized protein n=1 Tax=Naegleria lovaniensis TaxID=51637 RepID=A0AA88GZT4_NAELO|nr:uncharacterized protein C9374_000108 [Naegleria lovaniensis]KAG2388669.1 hypothetical protein C9374_000108 [Naegleria lovaniensis]